MSKSKKSKKEVPEGLTVSIKLTDNQKMEISAFRLDDDDDGENLQINIRKFYRTQKDKTWKPARQGMTIPLELAKKFRQKLKGVCDIAEEAGDDVPKLEKRKDD
jgi:hypothetical protein